MDEKSANRILAILSVIAALIVVLNISNILNSKKDKRSVSEPSSYSDDVYEDDENQEALSEAYWKGFLDGLSENVGSENSNSDVDYIVRGILEEANYFATEGSSDISLWDAMDIASAYLDGGYPRPTMAEFEDAVDVLLRYAMFLEWNNESFASIMEDYDPFY